MGKPGAVLFNVFEQFLFSHLKLYMKFLLVPWIIHCCCNHMHTYPWLEGKKNNIKEMLLRSALASSLLQFLCWQNIPALQMPGHVTRSKNAFCTSTPQRTFCTEPNINFLVVTSYSSPPHPLTLASQFYFFHTADHLW